MLTALEYAGSYYPVRRYVASLRQGSRETFVRIDHVPGRRMEFDFGQVQVDYPWGRRTTDVLSGVWTYSNCPFLMALPSQRSESILEGMKSAFECFTCVPRALLRCLLTADRLGKAPFGGKQKHRNAGWNR